MGAIVCRLCRFAHDGPCKKPVTFRDIPYAGQAPDNDKITYRGEPPSTCAPKCKECLSREVEINRLKSDLAKATHYPTVTNVTSAAVTRNQPKRDRAAYMREFRKKK